MRALRPAAALLLLLSACVEQGQRQEDEAALGPMDFFSVQTPPSDLPLDNGLYPGEGPLAAPPIPQDNPQTPQKIELGKLLFFDPILSGDDDTSCASCHDPKYGFSDGLPTAVGHGATGFGPARRGGPVLGRATPSIWNSAYYDLLFWDGRAASLEEQALGPMTARDEMRGQNVPGCGDAPGTCPEAMEVYVQKLRAIPDYVERFSSVFPQSGSPEVSITAENILKAIASFERTLVSRDTRYDRFIAGEGSLTTLEQRGRVVFFEVLRCQDCHAPPLFSSQDFFRVGLAGGEAPAPDDPGLAAVTGRIEDLGKFKATSLRNSDITGPWMRDGSLSGSIENVVHFYHTAGAETENPYPLPRDHRIPVYPLSDEDHIAIVAFLRALTDESAKPARPESVPSGLPPGGDPIP